MEMEGYKILTEDLKNKYGQTFLPGNIYTTKNEIHIGTDGHGFHFSPRFEDAFKYLEAFTREISIVRVKASGKICETYDRFHGGENVYACSQIEILSILTEEEILTLALSLHPRGVQRFLQHYPLTEEEKIIFKMQYPYLNKEVKMVFDFFQEGKTDAYLYPGRYRDTREDNIRRRF